MKKFIVFLTLLVLFPTVVMADDGYKIENYDVNIIVNENNTFNIKETIDVFFNESRHGIYRTLPLKNQVNRLDGTTSNNRVKITDIYVDHSYTKSTSNSILTLKIGDPDVTLTGSQEYIISYLYNIGKDPLKEIDEFYFNIIGTNWDTTIKKTTFSITMPKEFDSNKLGFSIGNIGLTDSDYIDYEVNGNVIVGIVNRPLNAYEGLTIRLELPEDYFIEESSNYDFGMMVSVILPIMMLLIAIYWWFKYGKEEMVVETVEFYPPAGFNSAELGFLYKGRANNKDVTSLLIYLANKGYIRIDETEERVLFTKVKGFKITKLKPYDGGNLLEETFINGMFKKGKSINDIGEVPNEVNDRDLYDSFYMTINSIMGNLNKKENRNQIFEKGNTKRAFFISLFIIITYLLITVRPMLEFGQLEIIWMCIVFPLFALLVPTLIINFPSMNTAPLSFSIIWSLGFGGIPWIFIMLPIFLASPEYLVINIIGISIIIILYIIMAYMPKRSKYGNQVLGKIKGFRHFLKVAEKNQLEGMVMKNPTYFYDILPYTYVLGLSSVWIKKFESIALQAPNWYTGTDGFNVNTFGTFMSSSMQSTSAISSSDGGGGGSGGGSSGGGSGGGGGGSW